MLKMKPDTNLTTSAADIAAGDMRDALSGLRRPAALERAERALMAVRAKRAELAGQHNECLREFTRRTPGATLPDAEIRAGEAALAKCDESIRAEKAKLAAAREAFAPAFLAAINASLKDITAEIAAHMTETERLIESLADARRFAERNGIEAPRLLTDTYVMRECVAGVRRVIGR